MSANGQYNDPKLSQPAPAYYGDSQPATQPYYNSSQHQMHQMQPQTAPQIIHVNVNQTQKNGGSGCCGCKRGPVHNIQTASVLLLFFFKLDEFAYPRSVRKCVGDIKYDFRPAMSEEGGGESRGLFVRAAASRGGCLSGRRQCFSLSLWDFTSPKLV
ncbi:hypothetical protein C8J57DRAFT_1471600 [Mycena rebaudengoi]|nr:hypothetical protein C8J57DRAFT_1471600 [Mycena rebaudengoi]